MEDAMFIEHKNQPTMAVLDNNRLICRARHIPSQRAWLLKAFGFEWVDKRSAAPNAFGKIARQFMLVKSRREARSILKSITR